MAATSEVASWYDGKAIFITGASGFMGKVLLEKLLYSCPDVTNIYVLLRAKRGRSPLQRIEDMWKLPMFERLRVAQPDAIKKVVTINGDLVTEGLGICNEEKQLLLEKVSVVFHFAATLRLEGTLKDAVEMNTEGTLKLLELAKKMKQLKAFVHLSTAFCNPDIKEMEEQVYEWNHNPHEVIRTVSWMNPKALEDATKMIITPHPNTYIYSKRLAEMLVLEHFPQLPVVIARPSIVCPSAIEPVAGWVDNLNGPIGILVGAGKGVIRSLQCLPQYPAHVIPVDYAINAVITIGWRRGSATEKPKEIPVYNMTQDEVKKVTFGTILDLGRKAVYEHPFEGAIWYPGGDIRPNKFIHSLYVIFVHFLPAYFIDFLMLIFRQKRFMVRLQWRIQQGLELLHFFTTRHWIFKSKNFLSLWQGLNKTDREIFDQDLYNLDTEKYMTVCVLGARQYCMKENLSSLPRCRVKQKFLYVLDKLFMFGIFYFFISMLASWFTPLREIMNYVAGCFV